MSRITVSWVLGPNIWMDVGSIYHDRKIGMESREVMSSLLGHVEFEMPISHPNGYKI